MLLGFLRRLTLDSMNSRANICRGADDEPGTLSPKRFRRSRRAGRYGEGWRQMPWEYTAGPP